jgi:hypothetical protein
MANPDSKGYASKTGPQSRCFYRSGAACVPLIIGKDVLLQGEQREMGRVEGPACGIPDLMESLMRSDKQHRGHCSYSQLKL